MKTTNGKVWPIISTKDKLCICLGLQCAFYDETIQTCRLIAIDENLEILTRNSKKQTNDY